MKLIDTDDRIVIGEVITDSSMGVERALELAGFDLCDDGSDNDGLWTCGDGVYYDSGKIELEY